MGLKLQDLIDIEQFQMLQDRLNEIYSFPSAIIDNDGNILTATAWQDICTQFHRQNPESEKECIKSDQYIYDHLHEAKPAVSYECPHGLIDNATPIIIEGVHYGNFFTGQFFLSEPNLDFFREQAKKYGFDEEAYIEAVKKVPIWSRRQLDSYLFFIRGMIEVISGIGLKRLKEIQFNQKLAASEERANAILRQMLDGFWAVDTSGRIMDVNEAMVRLTGYTRDELLKMNVAEIKTEDSTEALKERMQRIIKEGSVHFESRFRRRDGGIIDIDVNAVFMPERNMLFAFHRDITERKRDVEKLREQEERMRLAIRGGDLGTWDWDIKSGRVVNNDRWAEMIGYTIDETRQNVDDWHDITHPDDIPLVNKALKDHLEGRTNNYEIEHRMRHKSGEWIWVLDKGEVITRDADGHPLRMIGTHVDITERKKAEEERKNLQAQLFQAQKMESIGQLAGGVAHDFNNMLGIIMAATELVKLDIDPESPAQEELKVISDSVKRARELTMKLLTFSRREKLDVRGIEIRKIIGNLQSMLSRTITKSVNLKFNIKDESVINCDQNQICQALLNVCNNAVDAMPGGGSLTIEAGETNLPDGICNHCGHKMAGRHCLIQISDTGVGMPKEILSKITEPFFTTKGVGKGTGLGLSVTHGIVLSHGGHLHIYSEPGKGTCVKIFLPIDDGSVAQPDFEAEQQSIRGSETILVVDDEEALLRLAGKMLKKKGYNPLLAPGGEQGIALYEKHGNEIAVVVLDLMMPGLDGEKVNERLMELNPDVKVVFSSGFSEDGLAGKLMKGEHRKFVQKPFEIFTLCQAIRELIDGENPGK